MGNRIWIYIPVVNQGYTRKFASFWKVHTLLLISLTYTVQLIGDTQILVVQRNRMKPCLTPPLLQTYIVTAQHSQTILDSVLTYADVAAGQPMPQVRVYTSVKSDHPTTRLTRTHRPTFRYDDYLCY